MIRLFKKIVAATSIFALLGYSFCFADDILDDDNGQTESSAPTILSEITDVVQTASQATEKPKINSRAAVVIDRKTKQILYGKNESSKRAMASTTKIVTAMVVIQNTNLSNTVTISKKAAGTGGSRLKLKAGDKVSVRDLLYGLLLRSGNDAAVALAEYVGGDIEGFASLMNETADMLGLSHTHFVTPHGLDSAEHYTTAYELALLADYALQNEVFANIVATKSTVITINGQKRAISNTNELLGNLAGVYGVKTGFTNGAGRCLVTSIKRGNLDVICVVLGADTKKDRTRDSVKLIEYTFKNYETYSYQKKVEETFKEWNQINQNRITIEKGASQDLGLYLELSESPLTYPIEKRTQEQLAVEIESSPVLQAPIKANSRVGKVIVKYKNQVIKELNILNANDIKKKKIPHYLQEFIRDYNGYLKNIIKKS